MNYLKSMIEVLKYIFKEIMIRLKWAFQDMIAVHKGYDSHKDYVQTLLNNARVQRMIDERSKQ